MDRSFDRYLEEAPLEACLVDGRESMLACRGVGRVQAGHVDDRDLIATSRERERGAVLLGEYEFLGDVVFLYAPGHALDKVLLAELGSRRVKRRGH